MSSVSRIEFVTSSVMPGLKTAICATFSDLSGEVYRDDTETHLIVEINTVDEGKIYNRLLSWFATSPFRTETVKASPAVRHSHREYPIGIKVLDTIEGRREFSSGDSRPTSRPSSASDVQARSTLSGFKSAVLQTTQALLAKHGVQAAEVFSTIPNLEKPWKFFTILEIPAPGTGTEKRQITVDCVPASDNDIMDICLHAFFDTVRVRRHDKRGIWNFYDEAGFIVKRPEPDRVYTVRRIPGYQTS